jgi:hypothetical protein
MGYTTDFSGAFALTPALTKEQDEYLTAFCQTRRMARDTSKLPISPNHLHEKAGMTDPGPEGAYFVDGDGFMGQSHEDPSIIDYNKPPIGQPGFWCQWLPTNDGECLEWDFGEKFYNYVEWLEYLIEHFFTPWGVTLNGAIQWYGDEPDDRGLIEVEDSVVTVKRAVITFE